MIGECLLTDDIHRISIFVPHGLNSSIEKAFTHANGRKWACDPPFWGHLADKIRMMTFSDSANAFHDVINARVIDHAEKLLEELCYAPRASKGGKVNLVSAPLTEIKKKRERPLNFIAHSMEGLVVKRVSGFPPVMIALR